MDGVSTVVPGSPSQVGRWDRHGRAIGVSAFEGRPVRGKAVLIEMGWSSPWRTDRYLKGTRS